MAKNHALRVSEDEEKTLVRFIKDGTLSEAQVREVLEIKQRHQTPLLDILGAMNYVRPADYALNLSEVTHNAYIGSLIDSEMLDYSVDFIRQFDPATMARYRFCPLNTAGDLVTVLVVEEKNRHAEKAIHAILPDADIMPLIGSEVDVNRMIRQAFGQMFSYSAVNAIKEARPHESASTVFTRPQKLVFFALSALILAGLLFAFWETGRFLVVFISLLYVVGIAFRLVLTLVGISRQHIKQSETTELDDADLPVYSVLVPVYKEPDVVPNLLRALSNLDYPHEKLDVLILLEEDDIETIAAAQASNPPSYFRLIIVPDSLPRTKPKACNYGLNFCRGDYVTIYDAEDIPEPDQLRKAVVAFRKGDDKLICVQSALNYFNANENYLTRMFTLEYTYWFDYILPGLDRLRLPIPLGGTSNHFRMDKVRELNAWDPYNVTEDADLGIRASANGYTIGVINSTTYEEANKAVKNWLRQRSRWIKGYMQTWLVYNRNPLALIGEIGLQKWLGFQMLIGGTVWVFLINPVMWVFFLYWLALRPEWMSTLFQGWVWDIAMFSLVFGNGMAILMNVLATLRRKNYRLALYALTNPIYWILHSISAYIALWQLIRKPFYWEKTTHGLTTVNTDHLFADKSG